MPESSDHRRATSNGHDELPIPPNLQRKLESFQHRLWSTKIAEGALAGLAGLGLSYLVIFGIDRVIDTPVWLRYTILALGFSVPCIGLPLRWHRWVRQQKSLEQVARLLRRSYPRLGDELLGIVELSQSSSSGNSRVLIEAAMRQVDARIANQEIADAVPANHYRAWLTSTVAILGVSAALILLVSDAAQNALARWMSPWKPVDRYTFAQLETLPTNVIVPYAENFALDPALAATTEWKPRQATVKLPGKTRLRADRESDDYHFEVPPQKKPGSLALRVGDEYQKIEVTPLPRPELIELKATLRLPDYLRYESDPVLSIRGGTVSVVNGASVTFVGTTSRDLSDASIDDEFTKIIGAKFSTEPITVSEPVTKTFSWKDIHGLKAKSPLELRISPVEDTPPDVFARQISDERIVLADEVVSFDVSASDDYGLKGVGLQWWGTNDPISNPDPATGEKPIAAGKPEEREIESRATFSASREGIKPQTIQLRAYAEDYLPDRKRSYSPTFVLHILSPEDHASWLTQEFGKWFRNAREVYEKEQQLFETNKSLRRLSADELDRPENRRQLLQQASAEANNGRRLDALTQAGRELVKQATKNDEFDAGRLESWATMMRALDDIAGKRMPSVSDLLKQASQSGGKETAKSTPPSEKSSPSAPKVANQKSNPKQSPESPKANQPTLPGAPSISDQESSLTSAESPPKQDDKEKSPGSPPLGLPQTTLGSAGSPDTPPKPESPAQELLEEAVKEQEDLLAEFARIADQLQEILSSLEASTFVKRLKAASRVQFELAGTLNETLDGGFGLPKHRIEQNLRNVGEKAALVEEEQSRNVRLIQTDLEAYFQRKQDPIFKNVSDQMKDLSVVSDLKGIGEEMHINLNGRSISASEFWGDTLDRWAEELVSASEGQECKGGSKDSLPPEVVLQIMKVLQEEMYLRDETREMEATSPILAPDIYQSKMRPLELTQADLRERIDQVVEEIKELPDADAQFANEIQLLTVVSDVMRDARAVLSRPDSGPEAIAAETEAIELLLQSKRQNSSGGGGGASPGGGGQTDSNGASLNDISMESDSGKDSAAAAREVDQSTGQSGRKLPEEFRRGLDKYFNALESN